MAKIRKFRGQRSRQKVTPLPIDRDNSSDIGRSLMKNQAALRSKRGSARGTSALDGSQYFGQTRRFPGN